MNKRTSTDKVQLSLFYQKVFIIKLHLLSVAKQNERGFYGTKDEIKTFSKIDNSLLSLDIYKHKINTQYKL